MDKIKEFLLIGQLVAIALLTVSLIYTCKHQKTSEPLVVQEEYDKGNTHVKTYESTDLSELKKRNEELYKLIRDIDNLESVVRFHYQYNYDSGIQEADLDSDVVVVGDSLSLYHFENYTDTVSYLLDVYAKDIEWYRVQFSLNDSLTIVNRNTGNVNQTIIEHSDPSTVTQVETWHPKEKKKLSDHFYWGAGVGIGYGILNKKTDIFVGVTAGITF